MKCQKVLRETFHFQTVECPHDELVGKEYEGKRCLLHPPQELVGEGGFAHGDLKKTNAYLSKHLQETNYDKWLDLRGCVFPRESIIHDFGSYCRSERGKSTSPRPFLFAVDFTGSEFFGSFSINNNLEKAEQLIFNHSVFNSGFSTLILKSEFNSISWGYCHFKGSLVLTGRVGYFSLNFSKIEGMIFIKLEKPVNNIKPKTAQFKIFEVTADNLKINDTLSYFTEIEHLKLTNPKEESIIENSEFYEGLSLINLESVSQLTIRDTVFRKNLDLTDAILKNELSIQNVDFRGDLILSNTLVSNSSEHIYRKIKTIQEKQGSTWDAIRFFAMELEARMIKLPPYKMPLDLSYWYWLTNNHGVSWVRPLGWLAGLTIVMAFVYLGSKGFELSGPNPPKGWLDGVKSDNLWGAFVFSFQSIKPVWLIGKPVFIASHWAIQALTVAQSIASIFLIAMSILSLKRRFKL